MTITSLSTIQELAIDAATDYVVFGRSKPVNPFCPVLSPDHHAAWRSAFEVALLQRSAEALE